MRHLNQITLAAIYLIAQSAIAGGSADTIFFGGPIVTVNSKNEEAQALAIRNGKIVAVGAKDLITKDWQTSSSKVIDLKGQTLMPGFVEPHVHIINTAVSDILFVNLSNFSLPHDTLDSLTQKLKARLGTVSPGGWLIAAGADPSRTSPFMAELNADILDTVSNTVPIFVMNQSEHIAYVNHKALELAGINDATPQPGDGGVYVKDVKGKLTGKLVEFPAFSTVMKKFPAPSQDQLILAIQQTMKNMAAKGITTLSDVGVGAYMGIEKEVAIYKNLVENGTAPVRVRGYLWGDSLPAGYSAIKPNEGNDYLRFIGVKYIADGSTQGLTAALNHPYIYPSGSKWSGSLNYKDDQLLGLMKPFYDQGWQIAIHANGDKAIEQSLNNYAKLLGKNPQSQDRRLRIEHFTINTQDQVKRAVKLGVILGFTIGHVNYWGEAFNNHLIGPERSERIDPAGDVKRAGGRFTFHSDSPVTNIGPLNYISEGVTRLWQLPPQKALGKNQGVSVDDAIRAVTIDAAYDLFAENIIGSLEVGKQADLVVLEKNPRKTVPDDIRNIKVNQTWINGKAVSWQ
jgi:predicted amidohydrolase YtcJ